MKLIKRRWNHNEFTFGASSHQSEKTGYFTIDKLPVIIYRAIMIERHSRFFSHHSSFITNGEIGNGSLPWKTITRNYKDVSSKRQIRNLKVGRPMDKNYTLCSEITSRSYLGPALVTNKREVGNPQQAHHKLSSSHNDRLISHHNSVIKVGTLWPNRNWIKTVKNFEQKLQYQKWENLMSRKF